MELVTGKTPGSDSGCSSLPVIILTYLYYRRGRGKNPRPECSEAIAWDGMSEFAVSKYRIKFRSHAVESIQGRFIPKQGSK